MTRAPYAKSDPIMNKVMWRNVVISSIWQSIILGLTIFKGPGWLTDDYWTLCLKYSGTGKAKKCVSYNPFFTDVIYTTAKSNKSWKDRKITEKDFDKQLLLK
jgi:hypothetical protein